jgi:hypothetical protein
VKCNLNFAINKNSTILSLKLHTNLKYAAIIISYSKNCNFKYVKFHTWRESFWFERPKQNEKKDNNAGEEESDHLACRVILISEDDPQNVTDEQISSSWCAAGISLSLHWAVINLWP